MGVKGLPITQERVGAVRWEVECLPTAPVSSEEEEDEDGHAAVQGVAGKVNEPLEERDESARVTGGGFSMPQAAPTSMGYHSCDCIEEGFNIQQTQESRGTACLLQTCHPSRS